MPRGRPSPSTPRIDPSGHPDWAPRVERVLVLLGELGPTPTGRLVETLSRRERWPGDLARHALAAAHPLALESAGVWFLPGDSRDRPLGEARPAWRGRRAESVVTGVSP